MPNFTTYWNTKKSFSSHESRANASKSSSSLINTAASARCGGLAPAFSRFNGFSGCKGKPLKRLRFLHPTIHRAEAAVLMRDGVRIPWNLAAFALPMNRIKIDNQNPSRLNQFNEKAHSGPDPGGVHLLTPRHSRSPRRSRQIIRFQARQETPHLA